MLSRCEGQELRQLLKRVMLRLAADGLWHPCLGSHLSGHVAAPLLSASPPLHLCLGLGGAELQPAALPARHPPSL